jgi:IclR family acetate operon transcriptional repressor
MTPKTPPSRLAAELRRVRAKGHALDDEEFTQGIRCLAAPVRNFTGPVVAAVGISGPIWRVSLERAAGLARTVSAAAGQLSQHLSGRRGSREDTPAPRDGITPPRRRARPRGNGGRT